MIIVIVTFTNDHSSISFELASRYISSRSSTLANPRWMNLALLFRPFTFLHRKRGEAYLRLDLKLKTIEKMHQTRNNHGMTKKDIKTSKNNQSKKCKPSGIDKCQQSEQTESPRSWISLLDSTSSHECN